MSEKTDILSVAREALERLAGRKDGESCANVGRMRRLAQAVIDLSAARDAFESADWTQVVMNGGPPCFYLENGHFCLRAKRWGGHGKMHDFVSNPMCAALEGKDLGGLVKGGA